MYEMSGLATMTIKISGSKEEALLGGLDSFSRSYRVAATTTVQ